VLLGRWIKHEVRTSQRAGALAIVRVEVTRADDHVASKSTIVELPVIPSVRLPFRTCHLVIVVVGSNCILHVFAARVGLEVREGELVE
jgi:hypothetical protein